ncbi:unnamed protein product [Rotaria sordida]|uniref:Carboxylesterase type B domain-containing protein n=1 Tax=Rotaria sordida TaxID=392033 RepID=A0A818V0R9_9BILA|nr:unnamed protein product [Rotaria sordida]
MWIIFLFVLICSARHVYTDKLVTVQTTYGSVQGYETDSYRVFYGIPYAKAPIGALRWNKPEPIDKWAPSTFDATKIPPACPQPACNPGDILCPSSMSEDCLRLNIFTPLGSTLSQLLPVMIFIHGGNFQYGSASIMPYNGSRFVNTNNVIFVPIQYRLGILGFLATGTGSGGLTGNYGLMDQELAINWITLFGQSAGAQSTAIHYLRKDMQSLFQLAIIQSCPAAIPFRTYTQYLPPIILLAQQLGCLLGDISCLRTRPYENIITAQNVINSKITSLDILQFFEPWVPVIDNVIVRGQLIDMYSSASFPLKPLITGTMAEEGLAYVHGVLNTPLSYPAYLLVGPILFGAKFPAILLRFPQSPFTADMRPFLVKIVTQWVFACPTRFLARNTAAYSYVFGYPLRTMGLTNAGDCEAHACHGYELPFLFQAFWSYFDNNDQYISKTMATYWTNFAKSGNPNNPVKVPLTWPKLTSKSDKKEPSVRNDNNKIGSDDDVNVNCFNMSPV